jgi:hypothetical protein
MTKSLNLIWLKDSFQRTIQSIESDIWKTISAPVNSIEGVHDLFFVFWGEKEA